MKLVISVKKSFLASIIVAKFTIGSMLAKRLKARKGWDKPVGLIGGMTCNLVEKPHGIRGMQGTGERFAKSSSTCSWAQWDSAILFCGKPRVHVNTVADLCEFDLNNMD